MAYSYVIYSGDGSTRTFSVPFPYISQSHVAVKVNGIVVPFIWTTTNTVQLTTAPAAGAVVLLQRTTPISSASVVFSDGGTLTAADLNTLNLQDRYTSQEANDLVQSTPGLFFDEKLTVTATNVMSPLTQSPYGNFFALTVQGQTFMFNSGAYTISGTTVTWNAGVTGITLKTGWLIEVAYTYKNPLL